MTTPTQPAQTTSAKQSAGFPAIPAPNLHSIVSIVETLAFIAAAVMYGLNNGMSGDAILSALIGASAHAYNH